MPQMKIPKGWLKPSAQPPNFGGRHYIKLAFGTLITGHHFFVTNNTHLNRMRLWEVHPLQLCRETSQFTPNFRSVFSSIQKTKDFGDFMVTGLTIPCKKCYCQQCMLYCGAAMLTYDCRNRGVQVPYVRCTSDLTAAAPTKLCCDLRNLAGSIGYWRVGKSCSLERS